MMKSFPQKTAPANPALNLWLFETRTSVLTLFSLVDILKHLPFRGGNHNPPKFIPIRILRIMDPRHPSSILQIPPLRERSFLLQSQISLLFPLRNPLLLKKHIPE